MKSLFTLHIPLICLALLDIIDSQVLQRGQTECRLAILIPFSDDRDGPLEVHREPGVDYYGYGSWPNADYLGKASFSLMAAAEMALRHFNTRDTSIVSDLVEQTRNCNITIASPEAASRSTGYVGGTRYLNSHSERRSAVETYALNQGLLPGSYCAVVGPMEMKSLMGMAAVIEGTKIPIVTYGQIDRKLAWTRDFPNLALTNPIATAYGSAVSNYFRRDILQRKFVAILFDDSPYGEQFELPFRTETDGEWSFSERFSQGSLVSIENALKRISDSGYRTIVVATDQLAVMNDIARIADSFDLLGEGYFWILSEACVPRAFLDTLQYPVDSPMDKLLRGAAVFTNFDPFVYSEENDPFLKEWRKQNSSFVEELKIIQPWKNEAMRQKFYDPPASYFQDEIPDIYASFIYDAVMAVGISACKATNDTVPDNGVDFRHLKSLLNSTFKGASGEMRFKFDEELNEHLTYRDSNSVQFGIYNIRGGTIDKNNMRSYKAFLTSLYSGENEFVGPDGNTQYGAWKDIEGEKFVFSDGTTTEPWPPRTVVDANYLSKSVQIFGFIFTAVSLLVVIISVVWIFMNRRSRLVRASQPEFLYLLCFGATMVSVSPIFVSFDEEKGVSTDTLGALCMAFPWFFVVGYLTMYSALLCKLWRLSKLMEMRKQVVNVKRALIPFLVFFTLCITILILWTTLSPIAWAREVISEDPYETYGQCKSDHRGKFLLPEALLILLVVGVTGVYSWRLRHVQSELSESAFIFAGIFCHIQTWLVGIPGYVISDGISRDAVYVTAVGFAFIFSQSLVILVIWPKIFHWARRKYLGENLSITRNNVPKVAILAKNAPRISGHNPSQADNAYSSEHTSSPYETTQTARCIESDCAGEKIAYLERRVAELELALDAHDVMENCAESEDCDGASKLDDCEKALDR